jgi:phenylacetate-CoA ligase
MPLIRYRCGDFVRPATGERCPCGRSFPLIAEVQGRVDDCVKLPDGRSIGRLDHIFKGLSGIVEAQIRQDQIDAVTVLVVPAPSFNDAIRDHLVANARERLGPDIGLDVKLVDAVPRTARGKLKGVVCNV